MKRQIDWEELEDFNNFDEAAKFIYDIILEENKPERPVEVIKNDLLAMTNGDIKMILDRLLPRYLSACLSSSKDAIDRVINAYITISLQQNTNN